jgi:hypothetical protein
MKVVDHFRTTVLLIDYEFVSFGSNLEERALV